MPTIQTEVTNISTHGFWILSDDKEYFLSFDDFPWFKDRTINDITNIQSFRDGHLYWENLDVDLTLDMIEHPERYPLKAKVS